MLTKRSREYSAFVPLDETKPNDERFGLVKRSFWKEMTAILLAVFVSECSRGLIVPSLYLYVQSLGGDTTILGIIVGAYSFGRLIGSVFFGWLYNRKGAKITLLCSLSLSIFGNLFYSLGSLTNLWIIAFSRVLTGLATGVLSTARAFIAERTKPEERTRFMAYSNAVQFIGFSIMPGFDVVLSYIDFQIGTFSVNSYTSPGLMLVVMNIAILLSVNWLLSSNGDKPIKITMSADEGELRGVNIDLRLFYVGLWLFISLNFVSRGILSVVETVGSPLFLDAWNDQDKDPVKDSAQMLLGLGALGLLIFLLVDTLTKLLGETRLLVVGFFTLLIGSSVLAGFNSDTAGSIGSIVQVLFGTALIWSIASPIVQTLIISAFSKILGSKPQGTMMGWIGSAASIGRIVLPVFTGFMPTSIDFLVCALLSAACIIAIVTYARIVQKRIQMRPESLLLEEVPPVVVEEPVELTVLSSQEENKLVIDKTNTL